MSLVCVCVCHGVCVCVCVCERERERERERESLASYASLLSSITKYCIIHEPFLELSVKQLVTHCNSYTIYYNIVILLCIIVF